MKRFKVITHKDLDGVGCGVVLRTILHGHYVFVKFVGYDDVNQVVHDSLKENWDKIFITDISVNKETAELIDKEYKGKVILIDHHPDLEWLNDGYDWATVRPGEKNKPDTPSGTSLLYEFLMTKFLSSNINIGRNARLEEFIENVRRYDTYIWKSIYHDKVPKRLNDYLGMVGFFSFMDEMVKHIELNEPLLTDDANMVLDFKEKEIEIYIKTKNKNISKRVIDGYVVGFLYAEQYHSELGNGLMELNKDLDLVVMMDLSRKKISIRSLEGKGVDCTKIAQKWYKGGGHELASGSQIPDLISSAVQAMLFRSFTQMPGYDGIIEQK